MAQEAAQRLMRLGLRQSMQIERGVDLGAPARKVALEPPFDRRERRRGGLRRSACRGLGWVGGGAGGRPDLTGLDGVGRIAPRRRATLRATSVQSAISSSVRRRKRCGRGGASFTAHLLAAEAR